jgi:hypothetical protein
MYEQNAMLLCAYCGKPVGAIAKLVLPCNDLVNVACRASLECKRGTRNCDSNNLYFYSF